jgi:hypothetical protein
MAKNENFGWLKAELISSATQTSKTDSSKTYQLLTVRLERHHKPRNGQAEIQHTDVTLTVFGQSARVVREAAPGSILGIRYSLWNRQNGQYSNLQVNVEDVAVLYVPQATGGREMSGRPQDTRGSSQEREDPGMRIPPEQPGDDVPF